MRTRGAWFAPFALVPHALDPGPTMTLLQLRVSPLRAAATVIPGTNYTIKVIVPKVYKNSTPTSLSFTWRATALSLGKFVIN